MYISRFYGSCGHIENEEISEERFRDLTKEEIVKTFTGDVKTTNPVSIENNNPIVHIYPYRFCICRKCMKEEMKEYE